MAFNFLLDDKMETDGSRVKALCCTPRQKAPLPYEHSKLHDFKKKNKQRKEKKCLLLGKCIIELELCMNKVKWVHKSFKKLTSTWTDNHW